MFGRLIVAVAGLGAALGITFFGSVNSTQAAPLPGDSTPAAVSGRVLDPDDHFWFRASIIEAAADTIGVRPEVVREGLERGAQSG